MKKKTVRMNLWLSRIVMIAFLYLIFVFSLDGCGYKQLLLKNIAYDQSNKNPVIYLKENEIYVPYLVLTSDYDGNVLLLRKDLLPEQHKYKDHEEGWAHNEYGSYYEESSIDQYLNSEFYESLSDDTRKAITMSSIEVTDKECYTNYNNKVHHINRNIFLLSARELGLEGADGVIMDEGSALKYFENKEFNMKTASLPDGTLSPYWTRTPDIWETCTVVTVGCNSYGSGTADIYSGVRPAFCMSRQTTIKERTDIIEGTTVYVIE